MSEVPAGASVYVVTEGGEILDGEGLLALAQAGPTSSVAKASRQIPPSSSRGARWVEPRVAAENLLAFLDWNTWHRRCCVLKGEVACGLGWTLDRVDGGETVRVWTSSSESGDGDDPAVRLLLGPSPTEPGVSLEDLLGRVLLDYHATGNGYIEVVRDATGRVAELYHVPGRTMRRGVKRARYWQHRPEADRPDVQFAAYGSERGPGETEVIHLVEYDPLSDDYGMPGWVGALASMGLDRTVLEFNTRLFQNSMMAHLAVVVEGGRLSEQGRAALREFVRTRATGVENAGRVLLMEDDSDRLKIRFEKLNVEVKDLMLTGIQSYFRDVVVASHGVPPRVLGIASAGQLGATGEVEGQLRTFREVVIRPVQRMIENALGRVLDATTRDAVRYRLRFETLDTTGADADAALLDVLLKHGVYAGDEARALVERVLPTAGR